MMFQTLVLLALLPFCTPKCLNPAVRNSITIIDDPLMHFSTVFIVEFTLECENPQRNLQIFAKVNEQFHAVGQSLFDDKFQLRWVVPHEKAKAKDYKIELYEETVYEMMVASEDKGLEEDFETLATFQIHHRGSKTFWVYGCELYVTLFMVCLAGYAFWLKSEM